VVILMVMVMMMLILLMTTMTMVLIMVEVVVVVEMMMMMKQKIFLQFTSTFEALTRHNSSEFWAGKFNSFSRLHLGLTGQWSHEPLIRSTTPA
jgi:type IV secretory pathway VirB3-like protein